VLALTPSVRAQETAGPVKHYYNKTSFRIPVVITDKQMTDLTELKLFVRRVPDQWACAETAPATQKSFSFRASADGEYWFNIVTVDKSGVATPENLNATQPALVVVVDTQPPDVELQPISNSGKTYLQCRLTDANPDYKSLKVEYQSADGEWHALEGLANTDGILQVPNPAVLESRLRIRAVDLAGNVTEREIEGNSPRKADQPSAPRTAPAQNTTVADVPPTKDTAVVPSSTLPPPLAKIPEHAAPAGGSDPTLTPLPPAADPLPRRPERIVTNTAEKRPLPVSVFPTDGDMPMPPRPLPTEALARTAVAADGSRPPTLTELPRNTLPAESPRTSPAPELPRASPTELPRAPVSAEAPRQSVAAESPRQRPTTEEAGFSSPVIPIFNSLRCRLDFSLDSAVGNVAEVEVWATTDGGRTWKVIGGSRDGRSPAVVEFPGEGRYGYAFVVKPVAGLSSSLPHVGEPLDGWIEIDTTRPFAELTSVVPGVGQDSGSLVINWAAKDANLGAEPIRLLYATQPGGPWTPIADRVANTGSMRWPLPRDIGPRVWVRMEVRDRAGNMTGCETPQPIPLEGPRAKVRVLGVGPAQN
jgi:hypothetical protein